MTSQKLKKLCINYFKSITSYNNHKNESEVVSGLNLVPLDEMQPLIQSWVGEKTWQIAWKRKYDTRVGKARKPLCTIPKSWKECRAIKFHGAGNTQMGDDVFKQPCLITITKIINEYNQFTPSDFLGVVTAEYDGRSEPRFKKAKFNHITEVYETDTIKYSPERWGSISYLGYIMVSKDNEVLATYKSMDNDDYFTNTFDMIIWR